MVLTLNKDIHIKGYFGLNNLTTRMVAVKISGKFRGIMGELWGRKGVKMGEDFYQLRA